MERATASFALVLVLTTLLPCFVNSAPQIPPLPVPGAPAIPATPALQVPGAPALPAAPALPIPGAPALPNPMDPSGAVKQGTTLANNGKAVVPVAGSAIPSVPAAPLPIPGR
ncbi:hypothetical protein Fcan01_01717 [Folsomia candida]|uniref:Uncharacterized protein n=1 Tax=Folsomia candida TaxID=158441 RepID=A0A226F5S4_FOLCA|nr:hypothetical protein Fcan01_01717 [Folsomia candida]